MNKEHVRIILKTLRGHKTQGQLNKKLNFETNQIARWESGHAIITWKGFQNFTEACHVPLNDILKYFMKGHDRKKITAKELLDYLAIDKATKEISIITKLGYGKIRKWQLGNYDPSLEEVLQVIEALNFSLYLEFLKKLNVLHLFSDLQERYDFLEQWKRAYRKNPKLQLVLFSLGLNAYRELKTHKIGFIASLVGITQREEISLLRELLELRVIEMDHISVKYVPLFFPGLSYQNSAEALEVRKYWFEEGIKHLQKKKNHQTEDVFGSMVLLLTNEQKQKLTGKIIDIAKEFSSNHRQKAGDEVQVLNIQLFKP